MVERINKYRMTFDREVEQRGSVVVKAASLAEARQIFKDQDHDDWIHENANWEIDENTRQAPTFVDVKLYDGPLFPERFSPEEQVRIREEYRERSEKR